MVSLQTPKQQSLVWRFARLCEMILYKHKLRKLGANPVH
jgi:hypothetical protein